MPMRAPQDLYVASPEIEKKRREEKEKEKKRKHARDGRTPDKKDAMRMRKEYPNDPNEFTRNKRTKEASRG